MAERDTSQPETAEKLGQQLLEFVDKTEFGTAQFGAVSDYLDLRTLHSLRELDVDALSGNNENKTKRESDIRIYELKIALLEHQIEQNKSSIPGYSWSYQHVETAFEDVFSLALVESEKMHPDIQEQESYARQICDVAYAAVHEIVSVKRDAS